MKKGAKSISLFLATLLLLLTAACANTAAPSAAGSAADTSASSAAASSASSDSGTKVETVIVGTEGAYPPFNYVDADGTVDGYDMAVVRALDELIPEVEFKFQPTAWDSIFVALESGKFDMIASQIAKNPSREEKYQFSELPYSYSASSIIYKGGRTDIHSLKDLHGKTVAAGVGSNNTTWLEDYNKKNNNAIKLKYYDGDVTLMLQDIISGRVDATINSEVTTKLIAEKQGLDLGYALAPELGVKPEFFLFSKNEKGTEYKKLIDKALKTLTDNGGLVEISKKYLGEDYSTEKAITDRKS
ncbi:transporter substrate-binding domain-containing protein [Caproiciproducens sp. CPB-2]|uniref:transporter substrate-binding domain-containing protein n=2 Tax=unclassified Caproiciproducens TaxID=2643836 RepID=UPI0023DACDB8|nr:transporter substrate-binding domain-containing protein [Caproiciproducens sp. CPB-2]MDF1493995.1 transporter substrate-binding domain-containing protein [Caproiciproducens sp. CPB-2]